MPPPSRPTEPSLDSQAYPGIPPRPGITCLKIISFARYPGELLPALPTQIRATRLAMPMKPRNEAGALSRLHSRRRYRLTLCVERGGDLAVLKPGAMALLFMPETLPATYVPVTLCDPRTGKWASCRIEVLERVERKAHGPAVLKELALRGLPALRARKIRLTGGLENR